MALSLAYAMQARDSWCRLFLHLVMLAASRTFCTAGSSKPIRMAMMAMTTSSSIRVKVRRFRVERRVGDTVYPYLSQGRVRKLLRVGCSSVGLPLRPNS